MLPVAAVVLAVGLVSAVPALAGTSWSAVLALLGSVRPVWLVVASGVWFAGLLGYSLVLRAALPGLTTRQALGLNLAGSAVANTVPAGGAVSMGLTAAMARSWGFSSTQLGAYFTVSNVWTATGRLAAGLLGLSVVVLVHPGAAPASGLGSVFVVIAIAALLVGGVLGRERSTEAVAALLGRTVDRVDRRRARPSRDAEHRLRASAIAARRLSIELSRDSWHRFAAGMACYVLFLGVLLGVCLRGVGEPAPWAVVLAAVGIERLSGAVPFTPGGLGVADLTLVSVLTATGTGPSAAAAATLLYRVFTFGLEIPVGGAIALSWAWLRSRARGQAGHQEVGP